MTSLLETYPGSAGSMHSHRGLFSGKMEARLARDAVLVCKCLMSLTSCLQGGKSSRRAMNQTTAPVMRNGRHSACG